jgi:hypothetical protein
MRVDRDGLEVKGTVIATAGVIGGCQIVDGVLQVDGASIRNLNADYITAGTLNVDRILAGSIGGADGNGKIAASTLSTYNTNSGINTNLGYAASYGAAVNGSDTMSVYRAKIIAFYDSNNTGYTTKWKNVNGTLCLCAEVYS